MNNYTPEITDDGTLILNQPVELPDILDVLIVGGGPGGTAAAFRAKELKLSALVIDFDDILKRIRDYSKDKLILPDFGGGDQVEFPKGGPLISNLHFGPIDKDDMCSQWKQFYRQFNVPAHIGLELLGLKKESEMWRAKAWNHNTKTEKFYLAKNIILTIGRGVPRRFDIPGNTGNIASKLSNPADYVGAAACVIGGGTSAAEAVIAISNCKAKSGDKTPVHWSYRGDKMPKVSKALADVFFDAYLGNGNIRYHPNSEPEAVVSAEDKQEYLSVRTARQFNTDGSNTSIHLEFHKEKCLACIGEDVPESFLSTLGIPMATGGSRNKKRMLVTPHLETSQSNIYLTGDILSPAYFETQDFNAPPEFLKEVKHRGNIKVAMRDAVSVINVIRQKLDGKSNLELTPDEPTATQTPKLNPAYQKAENFSFSNYTRDERLDSDKDDEPVAIVTRVLSGGVEENEYHVKANRVFTIGRQGCDISIPEDVLLSQTHASVFGSAGSFFLRDENSATGTFLRIPGSISFELNLHDVLRIGQQFLQFTTWGNHHGAIQYDLDGVERETYKLSDKFAVFGRDGDIPLDKADMVLSRRHLAGCFRDNKFIVKDLNSANGSYLKVSTKLELTHGQQFRVGQQTFTFTLPDKNIIAPPVVPMISTRGNAPRSEPSAAIPVPKTQIRNGKPRKSEPAKTETAMPNGRCAIRFKGLPKTFVLEAGQTVAELAEEHNLKMKCECHAGSCGSDAVRVLSGQENLNEMSALEQETLEEICELQPGEYRLACMLKATGPVELEIVDI